MPAIAIARRRSSFLLPIALAATLAACGQDAPGFSKRSAGSALTAIKFVQVAYATPQVNSASVTVKFSAAQAAGDLNVVAVGWNDTTATVQSVTDSKGNSYVRAVGPTMVPGTLTQSLYYAKNIAAAAAGTNSVTVKFSTAAVWVDVRILEYAGLDTSAPLDTTAAATGSTASNDSGPLTTTGSNELLFAANITTGYTNGPGSGFTSRVITNPDGDIAEDRIAASPGTYHGTANASGVWIMQAAAFRSVPQQPPTAPANLTATAASCTEIDLAWTASTSAQGIAGYRVERCQGAGCSNFAQIAAPTGTSYADTSRAPSTSYSYRVRAADNAGNLSAYSNVASALTPADTQPPTVPANLAAMAASSTQINVSWSASTDNVGVTGYFLERCQGAGCTAFAQIAQPAATSYADAGLQAATSYSYRVRATDAAGNLSGYSTPASATTPAAPPPPTPPSNLVAGAASASQIHLSWTASTSSVGVSGYLVERCQGAGCTSFAQIATPSGTSYTDGGLLASTSYTYRVRASDTSGNLSGYSNTATATTLAPSSAVPALVQHVSSSVNPLGVGIPGNDFTFTLPNPVLAGNCLILEVAFCSTTNPNCDHPRNDLAATPVTDNNGNRWPATPDVRSSDSAAGVDLAIFVLPNANPGPTTIAVHFTQPLRPVQYTVSEFTNIAGASPVSGSSVNSAGASPNLTAGSFTPANNDANGGNLILAYAYDTSAPATGNAATRISAGAGFTLLDADIAWGTDTNDGNHASEYFVQTTAAAINPAMTVTMTPRNDTYNVAAIALRAAPAGTAPPATGIRIVRVVHQTNEVPPGSWKLQFPSSGNLIVFATNESSPVIDITSVTDSKGNAWAKVEDDPGEPQFWYAANAAPDPNLMLTLNISGSAAGSTVVLYDIAGAATSPLDGHQGVPGQTDATGANISDSPLLTPASANGLTIASVSLGQGPSSGLDVGSPAGAIFDLVHYTGETDFDTMDNADCKAHVYNSDLSPEHWNWIVSNGGAVTSYSSMAVHFKGQ